MTIGPYTLRNPEFGDGVTYTVSHIARITGGAVHTFRREMPIGTLHTVQIRGLCKSSDVTNQVKQYIEDNLGKVILINGDSAIIHSGVTQSEESGGYVLAFDIEYVEAT
jgi:hypothetical protein